MAGVALVELEISSAEALKKPFWVSLLVVVFEWLIIVKQYRSTVHTVTEGGVC